MPRYDYQCEKCGVFEVTQPITEKPLMECPECGGDVQRLISPNVNIIFKGSGFYKTEYRSKDYLKKLKEEDKSKSPVSKKDIKDKKEKQEAAAS